MAVGRWRRRRETMAEAESDDGRGDFRTRSASCHSSPQEEPLGAAAASSPERSPPRKVFVGSPVRSPVGDTSAAIADDARSKRVTLVKAVDVVERLQREEVAALPPPPPPARVAQAVGTSSQSDAAGGDKTGQRFQKSSIAAGPPAPPPPLPRPTGGVRLVEAVGKRPNQEDECAGEGSSSSAAAGPPAPPPPLPRVAGGIRLVEAVEKRLDQEKDGVSNLPPPPPPAVRVPRDVDSSARCIEIDGLPHSMTVDDVCNGLAFGLRVLDCGVTGPKAWIELADAKDAQSIVSIFDKGEVNGHRIDIVATAASRRRRSRSASHARKRRRPMVSQPPPLSERRTAAEKDAA